MCWEDRVEFAAIPIVLALLAAGALLLLSASTEQWAWLLVAVPVLAVGLVVAWAMRSRRRPPPDTAPRPVAGGRGAETTCTGSSSLPTKA
jgi:hypothetical protein